MGEPSVCPSCGQQLDTSRERDEARAKLAESEKRNRALKYQIVALEHRIRNGCPLDNQSNKRI